MFAITATRVSGRTDFVRLRGEVRLFSAIDEAEEIVYDLWDWADNSVASFAVVSSAGEIVVEWEV